MIKKFECEVRIKILALYQYVLIFVLFMVHGNRVFSIFNDIVLLFILGLGLVYVIVDQSIIGKENIYYLIFLLAELFWVLIYSEGSLMITTIFALLARFCIAFLAIGVDDRHFIERFVKLSVFIAGISLMGYILTLTIPDVLKDILPKYSYYYISPWSGKRIERPTYYALFFQFRGDADITRNIGMFNEPGLFQIILNTTLYFLVFFKEQVGMRGRKYTFSIIIVLITLMSSQSVTGLLGMMIIVVGYLFYTNRIKKWEILGGLVILAVLGIVYILLSGTDSWVYEKIFYKIFDESGKINLMSSTGASRVVSMKADIQIFLENPLGNGTKYYESVWHNYLSETIVDRTSCVGFTSSLAIYGIVVVVSIWGFYCWRKWCMKRNWVDWAVCILLILNTSLAQPSIFFPAFIVMSCCNNCNEYIERVFSNG